MGKTHKKDFDTWSGIKKQLHQKNSRVFFHEREIWWCSLGENIGYEQDGSGEMFVRPVVVFKKFNNEVFLGIPLTKTQKSTKFYFPFSFQDDVVSNAVLSQVRLIDAKRLRYQGGTMHKQDFKGLKKSFTELIQ